jgi:predicted amidophosphoribosyltransferase
MAWVRERECPLCGADTEPLPPERCEQCHRVTPYPFTLCRRCDPAGTSIRPTEKESPS